MSDRPKRIQRKRTKGWRMPEGTVYIGRPGKFGNPFVVGEIFFPPASGRPCGPESPFKYPPIKVRDRAHAASLFRELWDVYLTPTHPLIELQANAPRFVARPRPRLLVPARPALPRRCAPRTRQPRAHPLAMTGERRPSFRQDEPLPITATLTQFCKLSGLGRSKVKMMIKSGELESKRLGGLRLIFVDSYLRLLGREAISGRIRSLRDAAE